MNRNSETGTSAPPPVPANEISRQAENPALMRDVDRFVRENEDAIVRDIARLVSIPSVEGPATPDAPYGAEPKRALLCALKIAEELGLQTVNCDNRMCYAVVGEDRGQGYLATIRRYR